MPRVFQVKSSDPKIQLAYTVEQAVGTGCPNPRADVLKWTPSTGPLDPVV
jgi:hypothetical protein